MLNDGHIKVNSQTQMIVTEKLPAFHFAEDKIVWNGETNLTLTIHR